MLVILLFSCFACAKSEQETQEKEYTVLLQMNGLNAKTPLTSEDEAEMKNLMENLPKADCFYPEFLETIGGEDAFLTLVAGGVRLYYAKEGKLKMGVQNQEYDQVLWVLAPYNGYCYLVDLKTMEKQGGENPDYSDVAVYKVDTKYFDICERNKLQPK